MRRVARLVNLLALGGLVCLFCSCDPVTRHEVLTTVFDGVPSLPPPELLCADYVEAERARELAGDGAGDQQAAAQKVSQHLPYKEKRCSDCHDKRSQNGLVRPIDKLCLGCHQHQDFIQGSYVHGPVAVRDCLACHDPHSSVNPALLVAPKSEICGTCHKEQRMAKGMHDKVAQRQMICVDCHDPHFGNAPFFLK